MSSENKADVIESMCTPEFSTSVPGGFIGEVCHIPFRHYAASQDSIIYWCLFHRQMHSRFKVVGSVNVISMYGKHL